MAEHYEHELKSIELRLKNWFLTRRVCMEKASALKNFFSQHNVTVLGENAFEKDCSKTDAVMWNDLTQEKPFISCQLSYNAQLMKAEMYMTMFKNSTNITHPCRQSGVSYLQCIKNSLPITSLDDKQNQCDRLFDTFALCRTQLADLQKKNLDSSLRNQDIEDTMAAELFRKRHELLSKRTNQ
ncbi:uncharacterized protein LOC128884120 [Hylaeus volcanicus]|uniref:uncharacterized protein LOC128884120 n=1 Tax=Hylaeus volcanicus TaxID=313075 RepID=UPI0023B788AC|nr:uncharacterized protein LOC128884120 [Hylaeus volcanicus]